MREPKGAISCVKYLKEIKSPAEQYYGYQEGGIKLLNIGTAIVTILILTGIGIYLVFDIIYNIVINKIIIDFGNISSFVLILLFIGLIIYDFYSLHVNLSYYVPFKF